MAEQTLWIVAVLAVGALVGTFWRMQGGFGPMNLRAVGLVLIAGLASILAIGNEASLTAAIGLLGAIAGYLFGAKTSKAEERLASPSSAVNAAGASFGDNATLVGRDLVNNIERMLATVEQLKADVVQQNIQREHVSEPALRRRAVFVWEPRLDKAAHGRLEALSDQSIGSEDRTAAQLATLLRSQVFLDFIHACCGKLKAVGWSIVSTHIDEVSTENAYVSFEVEREIPLTPLANVLEHTKRSSQRY